MINLLLEVIRWRKQKFIVAILQTIESLPEEDARQIAQSSGGLAPKVLQDILEDPNSERLGEDLVILSLVIIVTVIYKLI